jgi:hypothetical protein
MRARAPRGAYALTVFLSALLLFEVQFILAKHLLPWFGGGAAVWTTCMLFFQVLLLLGYAYAHALVRQPAARQRALHTALLAAALALLVARAVSWPSPLTPGDASRPANGDAPVTGILGLLASAVGLPYLALAATGPLLQSWYARTFPGSPYRLYALSNLGSLIGLLAYPLVVEPLFAVPAQARLWAVGFLLFATSAGICAWTVDGSGTAPSVAAGPPPGIALGLLWFSLAFVPSLMLLAVTNQLCQEIAVFPLLWMLPLGLYLLSFVLCFEYERFYRREPFLGALIVAAAVGTVALYRGTNVGALGQVAAFGGVLLAYGLVCHGELARLKPAPARLTTFYIVVASGGAAGGVVSALVAPRIFPAFFELHVALWSGAALMLVAVVRDPDSPMRRGPQAPALRVAALLWVIVLGVGLGIHMQDATLGAERVVRNFYGVLRVLRDEPGTPDEVVKLKHGRIYHGLQYAWAERRFGVTTYYGPLSGVGLALRRHPRRLRGEPLRVGVVGLGTGTLAAYANEGDLFRFYEINPEVIALSRGAHPAFTYLQDCRGQVDVVPGDARLSLEGEAPQGFDVLVVDAFSSDAIPVHLLTREALLLYFRHLRPPDGVLVLHVSNRFLDLRPVVRGLAGRLDLRASLVSDPGRPGFWPSEWILLDAGRGAVLDDPDVRAASIELPTHEPGLPVWTDTHSDLLRVVRR